MNEETRTIDTDSIWKHSLSPDEINKLYTPNRKFRYYLKKSKQYNRFKNPLLHFWKLNKK